MKNSLISQLLETVAYNCCPPAAEGLGSLHRRGTGILRPPPSSGTGLRDACLRAYTMAPKMMPTHTAPPAAAHAITAISRPVTAESREPAEKGKKWDMREYGHLLPYTV